MNKIGKKIMNEIQNLFECSNEFIQHQKLAPTNRLFKISILQCQLKETYQISESHDNLLQRSYLRKLILKFH